MGPVLSSNESHPKLVMQDFVDSLCQCFGTNVPHPPADSFRTTTSNSTQPQRNNSHAMLEAGGAVSHSSSRQRRSNSSTNHSNRSTSQENGLGSSSRRSSNRSRAGGITSNGKDDSASTPARTKTSGTTKPGQRQLAGTSEPISGNYANKGNAVVVTGTPTSSNNSLNLSRHKRKRSSSSRDNIFRTKSRGDSGGVGGGSSSHESDCANNGSSSNNGTSSGCGGRGNPFSRFLSNHPAIMSSLCFATPIKGDSSDDNAFTSRCGDGAPIDAQSVISACNDDDDDNTMTSTVYYETTKLAGLRQTNPPMPLFKHFAVAERDEIHKIVATHSHSSARLMDLFRQSSSNKLQQHQHRLQQIESICTAEQQRISFATLVINDDLGHAISSNHNSNNGSDSNNGNHHPRSSVSIDWKGRQGLDPEADNFSPPPMTHSSSDSKSSKSSAGSFHNHPRL